MTKIKFCGLTRTVDIEAANEIKPEYVGFVFARKSRRYVQPETAAALKKQLHRSIAAVGVFVNEKPENIVRLLDEGIIDIAQLHGSETAEYIRWLRTLTRKPFIQAFRIETREDAERAQNSLADYILLDSGEGGTGTAFDWRLIRDVVRPYFLAGGLDADCVRVAVEACKPYVVDVSSGIETDGRKDRRKMAEFAKAVRNEE